MKTRVFRLSAVVLTVAILIAISCGPKPSAPAPSTATPAPTPSPVAPPVPSSPPELGISSAQPPSETERPRYGGTINMLQAADIGAFDPALGTSATFGLTNDQLTQSDWTKGPAGTGENDMMALVPDHRWYTGNIAESWKIPAIGVMTFQIRRGIRYALNPASEASRLVNGRELTADDIIFSVRRISDSPFTSSAMTKAVIVEKTGPWEVTIKTPVDPWTGFSGFFYGTLLRPYPPEVVQKYGNMNDWRNSVGTGAWMLTDFVSGGAATLKRNPNYYDTNPLGPGKGDQLPYIDTLKLLIITDISTRLAALRTGRLDWAAGILGEDARSLKKTTPRLKFKARTQNYPIVVAMRLDKPELPFKDVRVRQALMMATDMEAMKNELYDGEANILSWPVIDAPETKGAHRPLKELPESVQALYKYNPTRAKQLLAEAGYPNGFKTKMIVQSIATHTDPAAALKAMWAKVGVEVELQFRETAVFNTISRGRAHEETLFVGLTPGKSSVLDQDEFRGELPGNKSYVRDPKVEEVYQEIQKHIIVDMPRAFKLFYDSMPYVLEQAFNIPTPAPWTYIIWQPWMKNYLGQNTLSFGAGINWVKYVWIDQDLKEQLTGRR